MTPTEALARARFWPKVDYTAGMGACWPWKGSTLTHGYGRLHVPRTRREVKAHRFAYEYLVGPIPAGLELDHLCRNRACVNPLHLEPVSHRENLLRGDYRGRRAYLTPHHERVRSSIIAALRGER